MYGMQKSVSTQNVAGRGSGCASSIQKSRSMGNCIVEKERGFKPSDRYDPQKKEFLVNLSKQIWQRKEGSQTITKGVDLQKIFTPASDAEEIIPKNRKLYASSAFYSPSLHPTVEDQVELARRISHSLSDISNQQSKGQSMYVNRKKRSVKWVHEGEGQAETQEYIDYEESKENDYDGKTTTSYQSSTHDKVPLKLVMNPRGQIRDITSVRDDLYGETGLMSPDKCAELVNALNAPKGRGAELFAKRRKKAEKWIVDETNAATSSPGGVPYNGGQRSPYKPNSPLLPAYSDVGIHRVQLNMQQDQIQNKYANQGIKMVKTPWEAALETGSASTAFEGGVSPNYLTSTVQHQQPQPIYDYGNQGYVPPPTIVEPTNYEKPQTYAKPAYNSQRDLAYKPSIAQGWKAPPVTLPKDIDNASSFSSASASESIHNISSNNNASSAVNESVNATYDYAQSDEDEIIKFMEKSKLAKPGNEYHHDIVNCFAKSPELMVSDANSHLLQYDNAVRELQKAIVRKSHESANVVGRQPNAQLQIQDGDQCQQYQQRHHQQYQQQQQTKPQLQKPPPENDNLHLFRPQSHNQIVPKIPTHQIQAKPQQLQQQQQSQPQPQRQPQPQYQQQHHLRYQQQQIEHPSQFNHRDNYPFRADLQTFQNGAAQPMPARAAITEEIEYVKVPVKDLISNFENQTKEQIEKIQTEVRTTRKSKPLSEHQENQMQQRNYDAYLASIVAEKSQSNLANQSAQSSYQEYDDQLTRNQQTATQSAQYHAQDVSQFTNQSVYQNQMTQEQQIATQSAQYQSQMNQAQSAYQNHQRNDTTLTQNSTQSSYQSQQLSEYSTQSSAYENTITEHDNQSQSQYQSYSTQKSECTAYNQAERSTQYAQLERDTNESKDETVASRIVEQQATSESTNQELYVPKEIPLDSYVPPATEQYLPKQSFPTYRPQPIQPPNGQYSSFPVTKPILAQQPPLHHKQQSWAGQQSASPANPSPIAFNPSPLSYDKLAKFQQEDAYANAYPVRKPLALPATKVRNISPLPFGAAPAGHYQAAPAPSTPIHQAQSPYHTPTPSRPVSQQLSHDYQGYPYNQQLPPQQQQQHQLPVYNPYSDDHSQSQSVSSRVSSVDLSHCQNFNTAARGWGKKQDSYRPITFAKQQQIVGDMPYTDF